MITAEASDEVAHVRGTIAIECGARGGKNARAERAERERRAEVALSIWRLGLFNWESPLANDAPPANDAPAANDGAGAAAGAAAAETFAVAAGVVGGMLSHSDGEMAPNSDDDFG